MKGGLGNQIAFNYRIHDPRVGRFLSVDPIAAQYPGVSPYSFAHNKVNFGNELEGLEILDGFFKYNQWALSKVGLGDTWVGDMNNSLYKRFSVEGRITQVKTAVDIKTDQMRKNPREFVINELFIKTNPALSLRDDTKSAIETVKRLGSGIAHGNTDDIAEGIDMTAQFYAGYKAGNAKLPKPTEPLPSLSKRSLGEVASATAKKNSVNFKCMECADDIVNAVKNEGGTGTILDLKVVNGGNRVNIWSDKAQDAISLNGRHRGVLVEGKVYDNIHYEGVTYDQWFKDFHTISGQFKVESTKF